MAPKKRAAAKTKAAAKPVEATDAVGDTAAVTPSPPSGVDLTLMNIIPAMLSNPVGTVKALLFERRYFWLVARLLAAFQVSVGLLIIMKVPYTKIDWVAYMQQAQMFLDGERDYSKIEGETGPLVYPALHLYIYTGLNLILPASGRERPAQVIFLLVELLTFLLVATIYYLAGRTRHIPQWLLIPLVLSKRSHSIYLLRLFNDPFAMLFLYASVVLFMLQWWKIGSIVFSLALGVKMNILLFVPGLIVLLFQYRGFFGVVDSVFLIGAVQIGLPSLHFFNSGTEAKAYFLSAFDFSRQFLFKWTVNWRFVGETVFLSQSFARGLLLAQAATLVAFGLYRWCPVPGGTKAVLANGLYNLRSLFQPSVAPGQLPSSHIPLVLFTSNLIGMTFSRSLHYQFYAWYFHQLPLLGYLGAGWGEASLTIGYLLLLERSWLTYPSTSGSSFTMLVVHLAMIAGLWMYGPKPTPAVANDKKRR